MLKLVSESLQDYLYEDASISSDKPVHPAKTLKDMLSMPYDDFLKILKHNANDPKLLRIMNLGKKDGFPSDEAIMVTSGLVAVKNLRPTQSQLSLKSSIIWLRDHDLDGKIVSGFINGETSHSKNLEVLIARI